MTNLLYWAEPIDQAVPTDKCDQYVKYANDLGWSVFRPRDAFTVSVDPTAALEAANRGVLAECDALVAWLPDGVPTIGVPAEIEAALNQGKPVGIITDMTESWSITGFAGRGAVVGPDAQYILMALAAMVDTLEESASVDTLGFVGIDPLAVLPMRSHPSDVGFDLYTTEEVTIPPNSFADVPTGVVCNLPTNAWGLITGRSSALRKHGLLVVNGVIDPGFRGPLFAGCFNMLVKPVTVNVGQRVAQLILIPALIANPVWDARVTESDRGERGFGSSGA